MGKESQKLKKQQRRGSKKKLAIKKQKNRIKNSKTPVVLTTQQKMKDSNKIT